MKRPVTFVLIASLLVSASALAAGDPRGSMKDRSATQVVRNDNGNRGSDYRGNDNRGHDNRGHDNRGSDNRGSDRGHDNSHWNNDRGDRGNHAPPSYGRPPVDHRNDGRNDHRNDRPDWNDHRNNYHGNNNGWSHSRSDWDRHPNYNDNRRYDRRDYARYRYNYGHYSAPRGYHYRVWYRGDRLPRSYYGSSYIVYDWRPYRLYEPPYGYHWVRVGNDVLLTALATGVVLDVLYDIWY